MMNGITVQSTVIFSYSLFTLYDLKINDLKSFSSFMSSVQRISRLNGLMRLGFVLKFFLDS
jgi:hypothetical protein